MIKDENKKEYILNLIKLNSKLDTLRINISLICYNLTNFSSELAKVNDVDFTKLNKIVDSIFAELEPKDDAKDNGTINLDTNRKDLKDESKKNK